MAVELVYETHSITLDNERGVATGWLPGELSERGRLLARELALLGDVMWSATKTSLRFKLTGSWEYDPTVATGTVKLGKDGRLAGTFNIERGDRSRFIAERSEAPRTPIPPPPSPRDKRSRW